MARAAIKVAVTVPADLFRDVESARKRRSQTRSAAVQEALRQWLRGQHHAMLVREYEAGYRRKPEAQREIEDALATSMGLLRDEDDW